MKKRLFFNKYNEMKYISHLDLLRVMDRLLRRSGVPIKYSQGFHPRPKISLGNPISLGTEAFNEPMDIELKEDMTNEELLDKLNSKELLGFEFIKVIDIDGKSSIVQDYKDMKFEIEGLGSSINKFIEFISQDEIILTKEKRGKITSKNLKPRIKEYKVEEEKLILVLENMSPNSLFNLCGIKIEELEIKKFGMVK
ncbi:TIGR03936 family radical SAM-associated protein [Fusobacterium sp. MFO224]|uniref:TIGR03936 family radical SAM-associated protein n=1 Tax=Fusobacterium sp. MFO224 TaxID=3378070 RepID=UPI0038537AB6